MRDQNSVVVSSAQQHGHVIKAIQACCLCGLQIEDGLAAMRRRDN
jgi:hypothetical protein